jgi:hypothetical protein
MASIRGYMQAHVFLMALSLIYTVGLGRLCLCKGNATAPPKIRHTRKPPGPNERDFLSWDPVGGPRGPLLVGNSFALFKHWGLCDTIT